MGWSTQGCLSRGSGSRWSSEGEMLGLVQPATLPGIKWCREVLRGRAEVPAQGVGHGEGTRSLAEPSAPSGLHISTHQHPWFTPDSGAANTLSPHTWGLHRPGGNCLFSHTGRARGCSRGRTRATHGSRTAWSEVLMVGGGVRGTSPS